MNWTWLLVLVCPLMMVFMMFGMMRGGHQHSEKGGDKTNLEKDMEHLRQENQQMRQALHELKQRQS
jgi:hypothetical protein